VRNAFWRKASFLNLVGHQVMQLVTAFFHYDLAIRSCHNIYALQLHYGISCSTRSSAVVPSSWVDLVG
jgi:hypothetical protein